VIILDADKEGFLRSEGALIQTIGRAARHVEGQVIMYADNMTGSMERAIQETYRRRAIQQAYNEEHGITPRGITKEIKDLTDRVRQVAEESGAYDAAKQDGAGVIAELPKEEVARLIKDLETQMKQAAKMLEFEKAGILRDQIIELRKIMEGDPATSFAMSSHRQRAKQPNGNGRADKAGAAPPDKSGNKAGGRAAPRRRARYS